jgi:hypothetical protein
MSVAFVAVCSRLGPSRPRRPDDRTSTPEYEKRHKPNHEAHDYRGDQSPCRVPAVISFELDAAESVDARAIFHGCTSLIAGADATRLSITSAKSPPCPSGFFKNFSEGHCTLPGSDRSRRLRSSFPSVPPLDGIPGYAARRPCASLVIHWISGLMKPALFLPTCLNVIFSSFLSRYLLAASHS